MGNIRTLCRSVIVILIWSGFSALATVYHSDGSAASVPIGATRENTSRVTCSPIRKRQRRPVRGVAETEPDIAYSPALEAGTDRPAPGA